MAFVIYLEAVKQQVCDLQSQPHPSDGNEHTQAHSISHVFCSSSSIFHIAESYFRKWKNCL